MDGFQSKKKKKKKTGLHPVCMLCMACSQQRQCHVRNETYTTYCATDWASNAKPVPFSNLFVIRFAKDRASLFQLPDGVVAQGRPLPVFAPAQEAHALRLHICGGCGVAGPAHSACARRPRLGMSWEK